MKHGHDDEPERHAIPTRRVDLGNLGHAHDKPPRAAYFRHAYTSSVEIAFRGAVIIGRGRSMKISLAGEVRPGALVAAGVVFRRRRSLLTSRCFKPGHAHHAYSPPRPRASHC